MQLTRVSSSCTPGANKSATNAAQCALIVRPPNLRSGEPARSSPPPRLTSVIIPVITAVVLRLAAIEVRRVVRAPGSAVDRSPRVCAQRPGTQDALRGLVVDVLHRDDALRRDALLHPALERGQDVVLRRVVERRGLGEGLAERIRARPATAVQHPRRHEEAIEVAGASGFAATTSL